VSESRKPGTAIDQSLKPRVAGEPTQRRSPGERFTHFNRLARSLPAALRGEPAEGPDEPSPREERYAEDPALWSEGPGGPLAAEADYSIDDELADWYEAVPRFPVVRTGYDCAAVDEHIARLEQELSELDRELAETRARTPSQDEVAAEIERIGAQTSGILVAAHERAHETTRQAQAEADRCLADATARARSVADEAQRRVQEAQRELDELAGERARLLADMESLAATLSTVAREASRRYTDGAGQTTGAADLSQAPDAGVVSSDAPRAGVVSSDAPRAGVVSSDAPKAGVVSESPEGAAEDAATGS
jgi:cell division septum initiation protein DivIVA